MAEKGHYRVRHFGQVFAIPFESTCERDVPVIHDSCMSSYTVCSICVSLMMCTDAESWVDEKALKMNKKQPEKRKNFLRGSALHPAKAHALDPRYTVSVNLCLQCCLLALPLDPAWYTACYHRVIICYLLK